MTDIATVSTGTRRRQRRPAKLGLGLEIETPSGEKLWHDGDSVRENRPPISTITTRIDEGFGEWQIPFHRSVLRDFPDLQHLSDYRLLGVDGDVATEGRLVGVPRETGDGETVIAQIAGWMGHLSDRPFSSILIDQALDGWGEAPLQRRKYNANLDRPHGTDYSVEAGEGLGFKGVTDKAIQAQSGAESWYRAPEGELIAKVVYSGTQRNAGGDIAAPTLRATEELSGDPNDTYNLTLDGTLRVVELDPPRPYVFLRTAASGAHTPTAPFTRRYDHLAVIGTHGLELHPTVDGYPQGPTVSDSLRHILGLGYPLIDTSGIQDTSFPISQGAFDAVTAKAALDELNTLHLWHPAVWEHRRFDYGPADLTGEADWHVQISEPGVRVSPGGVSMNALRNGIVVSYEDLRDGPRTLWPDAYSELRDENPDNPANRRGLEMWGEEALRLDFPTDEAHALQAGRVALAELSRTREPCRIDTGPYVFDRESNPHPGWKVRSGQTVSVVNHPNPSPRLITETTWDHVGRSLSLSADRLSTTLSAQLARINQRRSGRGLG